MNRPTTAQFLAALARTEQLAPAPRTLGRVLQLLHDADSALHAIADLISRDAALAVEVLRCANSAYYSRGTRAGAIDEAIHVIGFHETIRIVSLVVIRQTTHRDLACYGIAAEDFWSESVFNGLFLEALARRTGAADPGEAYTAGLLRFIGRLALDQTIQDFGGGLCWDGHTPLPAWEQAVVGVTQAEAGALLLRKWQFPPTISAAVGAQDVESVASERLIVPLSSAMNFTARVLTAGTDRAAIESTAIPPPAWPAEHPLLARHPLSVEVLAEIRAEARAAFLEIRQNLYPE